MLVSNETKDLIDGDVLNRHARGMWRKNNKKVHGELTEIEQKLEILVEFFPI